MFTKRFTQSNVVAAILTTCTISFLFSSTSSSLADIVTISDSEFQTTDWQVSVFPSNGASQVAGRETTGGNPDAFRSMTHVLPANSAIGVFHEYLGATYNPSSQGAIDSIDYWEDQIQFNPPFSGSAIGALPAFMQDGQIFSGPDLTFTTLTWETAELTGMTAADFETGAMLPDFSTSGGEIRFGYIRSNTNSSSFPGNKFHGIDNWRFELNTTAVPEPGSISLLLMVSSLMFARRRRLA